MWAIYFLPLVYLTYDSSSYSNVKHMAKLSKKIFKIKRTKIINALRHKSCTKTSYLYLPVNKIYAKDIKYCFEILKSGTLRFCQDPCYLIYEIMYLLQEIILHIL